MFSPLNNTLRIDFIFVLYNPEVVFLFTEAVYDIDQLIKIISVI